MNKVKLLLSLSLCFGLVACQSNVNQEDTPPEIVNQLDRTQADYTIEEIALPDEFTDELLTELTTSRLGKFVGLFHEEGYQFKLTVNDPKKARLGPADTIYDYNLLTNKLTLINPPIDVDGYRVKYHVVDEIGGEYDLIDYFNNGQHYKRVFYNGELVEGIENTIDNAFYSRGFQKLNGGIYLFAETEGKTRGKTFTSMYELNQGKAENLYQYDNDYFSIDDGLNKENFISIPSLQRSSKNRMGYAIMRDGTQYIHIFDGQEVIEINPLSNEYINSVIPLEDYVIYSQQIPIDEDEVIFKYLFYQYDIKNKVIKQIDNLSKRVGMSDHIQGNEFYLPFYEDDEASIHVCKVEEEVTCRRIEEMPKEFSLGCITVIDEKTDFIYFTDRDGMPHFYLIHWE